MLGRHTHETKLYYQLSVDEYMLGELLPQHARRTGMLPRDVVVLLCLCRPTT